MVFRFLRGEGDERLDRIEAIIQEMFDRDRREFDLAMSALFGDAPVAEVNPELRSSDQRVNQLQRELRQELAVHTSVLGGVDAPVVLIYMSIVKDVERLGDYAKNIVDLARDGADFATLPDVADWRKLAMEISGYIGATATAFAARDNVAARRVIDPIAARMGDFDRRVAALVRGDDTRPQPVARALAYRYLKRVVAHLSNVLSAVIMPIDKHDSIDEHS
jgi:phosphate uptake regulator